MAAAAAALPRATAPAAPEDDTCPTCCERYTASLRRKAACPFCPYAACTACVRRFLLSSFDDPHCMSCRRAWNPEFIDGLLTRAFRDGPLKKHREDVLLDRERSMLPATQPFVERIYKERDVRSAIARLTEERRRITLLIYAEQRRLHRLQMGHDPDVPLGADGGAAADEADARQHQARQFVRPCPAPECRGFLSTQYRCGLCKTRVCPDCHEVVATAAQVAAAAAGGAAAAQLAATVAAHACDPATVESVRAIARDSRPCPKCGAMIHRVSGCSQMFCTAPGCNTAFDWNTGRIETGRIHNPHYYEFMRAEQQRRGGAVGRELNDIPCGGMPSVARFQAAMAGAHGEGGRLPQVVAEAYADLFAAHRLCVHIEEVELRYHWRVGANEAEDAFVHNRDLRVGFLMGTIDETAWKKQLQKREKRRRKVIAVHQVLAMVANVGADTFRGLVVQGCKPVEALDEATEQMRALRTYANSSMHAISERFSHTQVPVIRKNWTMGRT